MDVGATLQSARERRGLSLTDVARRTRINVRLLRAIESGDFDALPAGIFTRGYLRAYAREVGLDPAETVERYLAALEPPAATAAAPPPPPRDPEWTDAVRRLSEYGAYQLRAVRDSEAGKAIAIALVCLGILTYVSLMPPRDPATRTVPDAAVAALPPGARSAEVLPASNSGQPVATAGELLQVELRPTGPCWVEAGVDGTRRIYRLMQAGDRETLAVHETLVLRVGNPAAFAFFVNGRPARLPGRSDQPITVRLGPENFTEFLSAT